MNKRGFGAFVLLILGIVLVSGIASAADANTTASSDKAYTCLTSKIESSSGLALQDAIFSSLAMGSSAKIDSAISGGKSADKECWPSGACKVKETAQIALAYQRLGRTTSGIKTYLDTRTIKAKGMDWFLQIDIPSKVESRCSVGIGADVKSVKITEEQIISGTAGTCFTLGSNGYWLKIKESCFDKDITISCDKDFTTSLLYQKTSGDIVFISGEAHNSAALGTTTEKVNSNCFETNAKCDYEATLWGAVAYKKMGADISSYMPYLLTLADDNTKYFPDAFLYMLTGAEGYYSEIVQSQKNEQYWDLVASPYGKYYDTALAMLALSTSSATELEATKQYLLGIQGKDGCWNMNIRDLAFTLYAGWPKTVGTAKQSCLGAERSCEIATACTGAGGQVLADYDCASFGVSCCSLKVPKPACAAQNGKLCGASEQCSGTTAEASDGSCCLGTCEVKTTLSDCEKIGGTCTYSCTSGETESTESCGATSSQVCCVVGAGGGEGLGIVAWALIFGILIVVVVIGILKRDKLRVWYYQMKGKLSTTPIFRKFSGGAAGSASAGPGAPPRFGPPGAGYPAQRPMMQRPMPARPAQRAPSDIDETLKKLREMTK